MASNQHNREEYTLGSHCRNLINASSNNNNYCKFLQFLSNKQQFETDASYILRDNCLDEYTVSTRNKRFEISDE